MKLLESNPELAGVAADLVERDESVVSVECGIFERLRHHRASELLESQRKFRLESALNFQH